MALRLILSLLLVCFVAAEPAGATDSVVPNFWDTKERLPKPDLSAMPRLRFLTTTDFPPFNFLDAEGRLSGFHVDLVRAVCAELGLSDKCQIQALPWGELDAALAGGEGEAIIAGTSISAETRARYAFSHIYLQFPARFVTRKADAAADFSSTGLTGKPVGVIAGSAHERMLKDYFPGVKPVAFATPEALYAELKAAKLAAVFGDGMRLSLWLAGSDSANCCQFAGGPYLAPDYLGDGLAIAVPASNPALAAAFDYALQQIAAKGIFAELYLRYFPIGFF